MLPWLNHARWSAFSEDEEAARAAAAVQRYVMDIERKASAICWSVPAAIRALFDVHKTSSCAVRLD